MYKKKKTRKKVRIICALLITIVFDFMTSKPKNLYTEKVLKDHESNGDREHTQ